METTKDRAWENVDTEDIPSDFFDDFSKEDFMDGLSVVDSTWDEEAAGPSESNENRRGSRITEALDTVKDLRELISDGKEDNDDYECKNRSPKSSSEKIDDFTKPGSRRDPNKTNEAIKRDKEVKVKEFLSKSLESTDDLRPPGTELDDYYSEDKTKESRKQSLVEESKPKYEERENVERRYRKGSPPRHRRSPRHSPRRSPRPSHRWVSHHSPPNYRYPHKKRSPVRLGPRVRSPQRYRHSPGRHSGYNTSRQRHYSPHRQRSRSPYRERRRSRTRSRSRSRTSRSKDNFLYPNDNSGYFNQPDPGPNYAPPMSSGYSVMAPSQEYNYQQVPAYSGYPNVYNYGLQAQNSGPMQMPHHSTMVAPPLNPVPPTMVPAPSAISVEQPTPYNALAQLVAEGKISQEDYVKLAPNKGTKSSMDTKDRVAVLNECCTSLTKLDKLRLPNSLVMNKHIVATEQKRLAPKYCSPLKRQPSVDFTFTKTTGSSTVQQNKQLIESIITTLGLENVLTKLKKKKQSKDMKDASVQTTTPFCDVCEIREHSKFFEASTSIDPEYFTSTVHTQVVEQDLVSSKSIFNPTGSAMDNAPISIAHLTPAQLVSQLAARAKTLKQSDPPGPPQNQYGRRYQNYDYDDRGGRGGGQYHNYNNYNNY